MQITINSWLNWSTLYAVMRLEANREDIPECPMENLERIAKTYEALSALPYEHQKAFHELEDSEPDKALEVVRQMEATYE